MSSLFCATRSIAVYIRYEQFMKFVFENEQFHHLLWRLNEEKGTGNNLEMSHIDLHVLYMCVQEGVMLMVVAADFFIKYPTNTTVSRCLV